MIHPEKPIHRQASMNVCPATLAENICESFTSYYKAKENVAINPEANPI